MMNRTELTMEQMELVNGGNFLFKIFSAAGNLGNKIAVGAWTSYCDARKEAETAVETAIDAGKEGAHSITGYCPYPIDHSLTLRYNLRESKQG